MTMKNSALIRIIIWSIVLILLLAVAGLAIFGNFNSGSVFNFGSIIFGNFYRYEDAGSYLVGEFSIEPDSIKKIDLDWVAGNAHISVGDGNEIVVSEDGCEDDDDRLRYRIKNGKIDIKFRKSGIGPINNFKKDIYISLPEGTVLEDLDIQLVSSSLDLEGDLTVNDLSVEGVSGKIEISGVNSNDIDISSVSGNISAQNITTRELSCESTSGDVDFSGTVDEVDFDSVSGALRAEFSVAPKDIDIETVSGGGRITMPKDRGAVVDCDGVSGKVTLWGEKCPKTGEYKVGDGYTKLNVETVSGDVIVEE